MLGNILPHGYQYVRIHLLEVYPEGIKKPVRGAFMKKQDSYQQMLRAYLLELIPAGLPVCNIKDFRKAGGVPVPVFQKDAARRYYETGRDYYGGPADKAGLQRGDVILSVEDSLKPLIKSLPSPFAYWKVTF